MVAGNQAGVRQNSSLSVDGETYISWAVINNGPADINNVFYVDLYFDDVVVERWRNDGLSSSFFTFADSWDRLQDRVRIQPGTHVLRLVLDSTNLIPETEEADNVFEWQFRWEPSSQGTPAPTPVPSRLPDLVPFAPEGWETPLIATSYSGDIVDGPLSVNVLSYLRYGIQNQGLSSVDGDVWIHVYLDDILVMREFWDGLLAQGFNTRSEWEGLYEITNFIPGVHTLRLVVDATDLVVESDEENNTFVKEVRWRAGPVPPKPVETPIPGPTPPAPLTLPNLVPGWRFGWDGPIIVSHETNTSVNSPLTVDGTPFIDAMVRNQSTRGTTEPFEVDLYFDGEKVHTFSSFSGVPSRLRRAWRDWSGLPDQVQITTGAHTLKMVIDPANVVDEANEDDNVYEKTFVWADGEVTEPVPTAYTDEQLGQMLSNLQTLLDTRGSALSPDGADHTEEVLTVVDAGYYLLTGKSFRDERVDVLLLTRDDFLAWIDDDFAKSFALSKESEYAALLARREHIKTQARGFKTRRFGKVAVVVDAEHSIAEVINTLAHELGHMRQDFLNPAQSEADDFHDLNGVQEAQAQQFERAFWLNLEELTGLSLLGYPDFQGFQGLIDRRYDFWLGDLEDDEHSLGYLLQWLAVLDDPELADLKEELTSGGGLGVSSALRLYDYLVGLAPGSVQAYVMERLDALDTYLETVRAVSKERLVAGLHPDGEGSAALRDPGLLSP